MPLFHPDSEGRLTVDATPGQQQMRRYSDQHMQKQKKRKIAQDAMLSSGNSYHPPWEVREKRERGDDWRAGSGAEPMTGCMGVAALLDPADYCGENTFLLRENEQRNARGSVHSFAGGVRIFLMESNCFVFFATLLAGGKTG
jgi:hypothetical protein